MKKGKQPNALITLYDVWIMRGDKYADLNIASWTPIDHNPIPPLVLEWCKRPECYADCDEPLGQEQLKIRGVESLYIPHAVEPVFKPTFYLGDLDVREYMGIDADTFLVWYEFLRIRPAARFIVKRWLRRFLLLLCLRKISQCGAVFTHRHVWQFWWLETRSSANGLWAN
jgi:hypothetical protein